MAKSPSEMVKEYENANQTARQVLDKQARIGKEYLESIEETNRIEAELKMKPIKQNRLIIILMIIALIFAIATLIISIFAFLK